MDKVFEDYFSELHADMVSICLEYVNDKADKIYIYCSHEENCISSGFFYCINNKVVQRHELNDALNETSDFIYDTSGARQGGVLKIINDNIEKIIDLCKEYNRDMPTEIKLVYDVTKNSLRAEYKYDLLYSNDPVKTADDIEEEWFQQIKNEYNR